MKTNPIKAKDTEILVSGKGKTLDRVIGSGTSKNTITQSIIIDKQSSTTIESDELYDLFMSNKGTPLLDIVNVYVRPSSVSYVIPIVAEGYIKLSYVSTALQTDIPRWIAENSNGDKYVFTPSIVGGKKVLSVNWFMD